MEKPKVGDRIFYAYHLYESVGTVTGFAGREGEIVIADMREIGTDHGPSPYRIAEMDRVTIIPEHRYQYLMRCTEPKCQGG